MWGARGNCKNRLLGMGWRNRLSFLRQREALTGLPYKATCAINCRLAHNTKFWKRRSWLSFVDTSAKFGCQPCD